MLPFADMGVLHNGPPPQVVLDQRHWWHVYLVLVAVTIFLRLLGLDFAGAFLTGMMLIGGRFVTKDGMSELCKYVTTHGLMCCLNFFFDFIPLVTEMGGRATRRMQPGATVTADGVQTTTYTITVKTTPFFDSDESFIYNVQSLSMIVSPIVMFLGAYLSMCAHNEINMMDPRYEDDVLPPETMALASEIERHQMHGTMQTWAPPAPEQVQGTDRFQGTARKLG